jgi:hypothetical protein
MTKSSSLLTTLSVAPNYPHSMHGLGERIGHPNLPDLVKNYLLQRADAGVEQNVDPPPNTPHQINHSRAKHLKVFHSARAIFCVPSNPSTSDVGMFHETIRVTPSWNRSENPGPRFDCIFVSNGDDSESNMSGLLVARVLLFFFVYNQRRTPPVRLGSLVLYLW